MERGMPPGGAAAEPEAQAAADGGGAPGRGRAPAPSGVPVEDVATMLSFIVTRLERLHARSTPGEDEIADLKRAVERLADRLETLEERSAAAIRLIEAIAAAKHPSTGGQRPERYVPSEEAAPPAGDAGADGDGPPGDAADFGPAFARRFGRTRAGSPWRPQGPEIDPAGSDVASPDADEPRRVLTAGGAGASTAGVALSLAHRNGLPAKLWPD